MWQGKECKDECSRE
jgi:hypothetical protein